MTSRRFPFDDDLCGSARTESDVSAAHAEASSKLLFPPSRLQPVEQSYDDLFKHALMRRGYRLAASESNIPFGSAVVEIRPPGKHSSLTTDYLYKTR